jgi:hypothetical protein
MQVGTGEHTYVWQEDWAQIPDTESARSGWAHSGVAVTSAGDVITFHPGDPVLLVFGADGRLKRRVESQAGAAHGICLVQEPGAEYLWVADNGAKRAPTAGYEYQPARGPQVLKLDLDGRTVQHIEKPDLPAYAEGKYSPTSVAVVEERFGGNGDVWVADGYGSHYVHRYGATGEYLGSINGEEGGAGKFTCPHAVYVDRRRSEPELYVADRGNRRVQVYDLDGTWKRSFGEAFLTTPSGFAADGDHLVVAELRARLTVLDGEDGLICHLGENEAVCAVPGWPNEKNAEGQAVRTSHLQPGKYNSPHGMATDPQGNVFVAEWLIGGRFVRLEKV